MNTVERDVRIETQNSRALCDRYKILRSRIGAHQQADRRRGDRARLFAVDLLMSDPLMGETLATFNSSRHGAGFIPLPCCRTNSMTEAHSRLQRFEMLTNKTMNLAYRGRDPERLRDPGPAGSRLDV